MYLNTFGFDEPPFSITPDPKFVFLSQKHQESLAHLVYGITRGGGAGFVQLTGEVGTGKTTISRLLLEQIPEKTNIALVLNPVITPLELIQNICKELKVSTRGIKTKLNQLIDKLNLYLLDSWAKGENTVVIIDEAQNLPRDTLEQLRLLTNLETDKQKLLQIILIGQPELRETMNRDDLRQLAQRVTARYHLMPLSLSETFDYLQHRISVAGGNKEIITKNTSKLIHKLTSGVPRLINILTDRALLAAYTDNQQVIFPKHIKQAASEVLPQYSQGKTSFQYLYLALLFLLLIGGYFGLKFFNQIQSKPLEVIASNPETISLPSSEATWRQYLKIWGVDDGLRWNKAQCPKNYDIGMACMRRSGSLGQIQSINHPVILELENDKLALLTSIEKNKVTLFDNLGNERVLKKSWLKAHWIGSYFIVWPMPAEFLINPKHKRLKLWTSEMVNIISDIYIDNNEINNWIKNFQNTHGLVADGIIGQETQMLLSLKAYNGPTLKPQK